MKRRWETEEQRMFRQYLARKRRKIFNAEQGLADVMPLPNMTGAEAAARLGKHMKHIATLLDCGPLSRETILWVLTLDKYWQIYCRENDENPARWDRLIAQTDEDISRLKSRPPAIPQRSEAYAN